MKVELEKTFLLKEIPEGLEKCKSVEILDIYFPKSDAHPILRLRKKGDVFEMTKKAPTTDDFSMQEEDTIKLSEKEFLELSSLEGKRVRKIRYFYGFEGKTAEIGVFLDDLQGLVLVDVEFDSEKEKEDFSMPSFCLADVTQEEVVAGGLLAGKKYADIQGFLEKHGYSKIDFPGKITNT